MCRERHEVIQGEERHCHVSEVINRHIRDREHHTYRVRRGEQVARVDVDVIDIGHCPRKDIVAADVYALQRSGVLGTVSVSRGIRKESLRVVSFRIIRI